MTRMSMSLMTQTGQEILPERFLDLHHDGLVKLSDPLFTCSVPPLEPESRLPNYAYCLRKRPPRQVIPVCVELEALKGDFRGFLF